jgi:CRISPR/Cas system CMR subunit Cmr4 (Cas7 group RAMP superfamily)
MNELNKEVKCVALGNDIDAEVAEVEPFRSRTENVSLENQIKELQDQMLYLGGAFASLTRMVKEIRDEHRREMDTKLYSVIEEKQKEGKEEIPEGTVLSGTTRGLTYFLEVRDGGFYVGTNQYESLSAAAQGVSGVRRSGWSFWKLSDGRSVKDVYKK